MSRLLKTAFSFVPVFLFCSALQASSISYTFTFNATSISAATAFSLSSPTLLPTTFQSFLGGRLDITAEPAPGAVPATSIPSVFLNHNQPGILAEFVQPGQNGGSWILTGITTPLTALGTYNFQSGSTVSRSLRSGSTVDPVTGSIRIASVSAVATPEPAAWLLSSLGLLLFGFFRYLNGRNLASKRE